MMVIDINKLTVEDVLAYISILAEKGKEETDSEAIRDNLRNIKVTAMDMLGSALAYARIESLKARPSAPPHKPKPVKASIPPVVDDMTEALREPLADAIEADLSAEKPGTVAETAAGLHQQTMRPEMALGPVIGSIKDPGKFAALVSAGWSKKDLAQEFKCDVRAVEEYCRVMRLKLHPDKRRSTVRALENLNGEAM